MWQKQNKNKANPNPLTNQSDNQRIALPPGSHNKPLQYTLTIQYVSTQLMEISPRPVLLKLQMWGLESESNRVHEDSELTFDIHTNAVLFRQYLRDMKVTIVKLCDLRNDQELGCGIINWIVYMRKNQYKSLPFIQDRFDIAVPILNYKKKQVAQIKINIIWQQFKSRLESFRGSSIGENEQSYRQTYKDLKNNLIIVAPEMKAKGKQISIMSKDNSPLLNERLQNGDKLGSNIEFSKKSLNLNTHQKMSRFSNINQDYIQQEQELYTNRRYPDSRYELEKAQLKLQAEQFLTLTKKENNGRNSMQKYAQNFITVKISELVTLKPNILVEYIDLTIISKKDHNNQKRQMRVFSASKQANSYFVQMLLREKDVIEMQMAKGLGKAVVEARTIKEKQSLRVFIYGKTGKFGSLNISKISQSGGGNQQKQFQGSKRNNEHRLKSGSAQKKTNPQITHNQQKKPTSPINNNLDPNVVRYLLITVHQAKSYQYGQFDIAIKNYKFSKPLPSFNIIPVSDLGSIFAIQFRNLNGETIDSTLIQNYSKIPIVQQNLGAVVIANGRVQTQHGYIKAQIMIGTMRQINYELARQNKYKSNAQILINEHLLSNIENIKQRNKQKSVSKKSKQGQKLYIQTDDIKKMRPIARQIYQMPKTRTINKQESQQSLNQIQMNPHRKYPRPKNKIYTQIDKRLESEPAIQYEQDGHANESKTDIQNHNQNENDGIWLIQILSRFLHALPVDKITQMAPPNIQQFVNLLMHFLGNRQQKQLIDIIIDMFIDDSNKSKVRQRTQNDNQKQQTQAEQKLEYLEFIKCLKSYHNFLELWWKIRRDTLQKLISIQPDFVNKINQYSELGMISKQVLWKKVFTKVDNAQLKIKVDKMLKISLGLPISAQYLIQQLKNIQKFPTQLPKQVTPELIMDLGKLIKQTIESILQGSGLIPPSVSDDRVNIRIMCDIFENINISLSYWQALMLIQQLKAWYNVDSQMNQGIVSGSVVQVWIKSVINRSTVSSQLSHSQKEKQTQKEGNREKQMRSSVVKLRPQIEQLYKQRNTPSQYQNRSTTQKNGQIEKNPSQRINHTNRVSDNKSVVKSELNQEQIFNIANLLRENDNYRVGTMESEKPYLRSSNVINNTNNRDRREYEYNGQNILNEDILNNQDAHLYNDHLQDSNQELSNMKKGNIPVQRNQYRDMETDNQKQKEMAVDKSALYLLTKIKSIKLKQNKQLQYPVKLNMRIYSNGKECNTNKQHYFFVNNSQQLRGKQLVQQLRYNWQRSSKGLTVQFIRIKQYISNIIEAADVTNAQKTRYEEPEIILYGILLNDQIEDILRLRRDNMNDSVDISKTKTIVLYGNKQIVGKINLQLHVYKQKPSLFLCENKISIVIQIFPDLQHDSEWTNFSIQTKAIAGQLYPKQSHQTASNTSIGTPLSVQKHRRYNLELNGTFYKQILDISIEGVGVCSVPLQQLYFKRELIGQYPVIDPNDGRFFGNLQVKLYNTNNIIETSVNTNTNNMNMNENALNQGSELQSTAPNKYLLIFDSVTTAYRPKQKQQQSPLGGKQVFQQTISIVSNIFIKDAINRTILYRSPYFVEHVHKLKQTRVQTTYISQFSTQNYFILEERVSGKPKSITIQLEYQSRHIGVGADVIKLRDYREQNHEERGGCRICYDIKYAANNNNKIDVLLRLGLRLIPVPQSFQKYNVNRIYKAISIFRYIQNQKQSNLDGYIQQLIGDSRKLTVTQQRLLKQISIGNDKGYDKQGEIVQNGSIFINYALPMTSHNSIGVECTDSDDKMTGRVGTRDLAQILERNKLYGTQIVKKYMQSYGRQYRELKNRRNKKGDEQNVDYIGFMQYTDGRCVEESNDQNSHTNGQFSIRNSELGNQAIQDIDKLYRQIKNRYNN